MNGTMDMAGQESRGLAYVIFNHAWDVVVGNRIDQGGAPAATSPGRLVEKYLEYLAGSLGSFARCHPDGRIAVDVRLVEISRSGISVEDLERFIKRHAPGVDVHVSLLGHMQVKAFVDEALAMPASLYRSPNRLHEFVLLYALSNSPHRHVALADPDVTFVRPAALDDLFAALAARPDKWAAAFVEPARERPMGGRIARSRERMHSVMAIFDAPAMRAGFPLDLFLGATSLEERLSRLCDRDIARQYLRLRVLDTFSLATEYLRSGLGEDRLLALNDLVGGYVEGESLAIVSDHVVHAKYLEPKGASALRRAVERSGLDPRSLPELERLLERCPSGWA